MSRSSATFLRAQRGALLVEVMVSALILIVALTAAVQLLSRGEKTAGETRMRAAAASAAEKQMSSLRTASVEELMALNAQPKPADSFVDQWAFPITTRVSAVGAQAPAGCSRGTAGYLSIKVTADYPARERYGVGKGGLKPVTVTSYVSRPASKDPVTGEAQLYVRDRNGAGVPSLPVKLAGTPTLSGTTDSSGCVLFTNVPPGNYGFQFAATGRVDSQGTAAVNVPVTVVKGKLAARNRLFDTAGSLKVNRMTLIQRSGGWRFVPTESPVRLQHNGMVGDTRQTAVGNPAPVAGVFPFTTPYRISTNLCASEPGLLNPIQVNDVAHRGFAGYPAGGFSDAVQAAAGVETPVNVFQPALDVATKIGGDLQGGAKVVATGKRGACAGERLERTTVDAVDQTADGRLTDPGFPLGTYDICVSKRVGAAWRYAKLTDVDNVDVNGQQLPLELASSSSVEPCP